MQIRDELGEVHAPPSQPIRRWDAAAVYAALAGTVAVTASTFALWHLVPGAENPDAWARFYLTKSFGAVCHVATAGIACDGLFQDAVREMPRSLNVLGRLAIAWSLGLGAAAWAFKAGLKPRDGIRHLDGPMLRRGKEGFQHLKAQALDSGDQPWMELVPGVVLPKTHWTRHALIVGGVGSGKTVVLLPIIDQLLNDPTARSFVYDVKGDFTRKFAKRPGVAVLSPWMTKSWVWDIGRDVQGPADAAAFASAVFPDTGGSDTFWNVGCQLIVKGCVIAAQSQARSRALAGKDKPWSWEHLNELLRLPATELMQLMALHCPEAAQLLGTDSESNTCQSLLATLAAKTRWIADLAVAWSARYWTSEPVPKRRKRKRLSLKAWANGQTDIRHLIVAAGPDASLTASYIGAMVNVLTPHVMSLPDDEKGRALVFVLDEFASLARMNLVPLLDKGRSKGVTCLLGLQDFAQVTETYGPETKQALVSMVGTHIVCKINPGETREQVANMFGQRRVAVWNGKPGERHVTEESRAVVYPTWLTTELGRRRRGRGFVIRAIVSLGGDPVLVDVPITSYPDRFEPEPAAWTTAPAPLVTTRPDAHRVPDPPNAAGGSEARDREKADLVTAVFGEGAVDPAEAMKQHFARNPLPGGRR
jgi:hypothetical protein